MKRLYVSTVGRGKKEEESSKVYCLDYDSGKIINSIRQPAAMFDLVNPRGGVRGCRGLCFHKGTLFAANFDGIFELTDELFITRGWWTELNGIHQIYSIDDKIQYAATRHDSIVEFDPDNNQFQKIRILTGIHQGVPIVDDSRGNKDTLHFNSFHGDYALFNIVGAIASIGRYQVLLEDMKYQGSHDLFQLPTGELVMNHSKKSRVVAFDINTWQESRVLFSLPISEETEKGIATNGFIRGMSYNQKYDMLFIGSAPASIYCLERASTRDENTPYKHVAISDEVVESVFDVIPHPGDWNE